MKGIVKFFKTIKELRPLAIKPAIRENRGDFWLMTISNFLQCMLLAGNIIVQAFFYQRINDYINGGPLASAVIGALVFAAVLIIQQVLNALVNYSINKFISFAGKTAQSRFILKTPKSSCNCPEPSRGPTIPWFLPASLIWLCSVTFHTS